MQSGACSLDDQTHRPSQDQYHKKIESSWNQFESYACQSFYFRISSIHLQIDEMTYYNI